MTQQIMKKLEDHDALFEKIDARFDQIDGQIDFLVKKFLDHDDRLERIEENMATKSDIRGIQDTLDVLVKMHQKTNQELTFMGSRVNRVEEKTDKNTVDIIQMKPLLGLG
jgi:chromosome segregation ATPase